MTPDKANTNLQQMMSTEQANGDATRQRQLQTWSALLDNQITFLSDDVFADFESLVRIIREGAESGVWGDEIAPKMIVAA